MQLTARSLVAALVLVCAARGEADDRFTVTSDTLAYGDTDNVRVISPQVAVHYEDEERLTASARFVVDTISAASVDVVSHATSGFQEVRYEGDLELAVPFGDHTAALGYRASVEPDYVSHTVRGGFSTRLTSATDLSLGYGLSLDTVGMSHGAASAFSESATTHAANGSLTQVVDRDTLLRFVYTFTGQRGYLEKPYRFVPLFDPSAVASAQGEGERLDLATFDRWRLPLRPPEEVPDTRYRHAFAVRGLRYVDALSGSLRLDYQLYLDDWGLVAHTVEPAVAVALSDEVRLDLWLRLYRQSEASFWERAYVVPAADAIPRYRTADRDLSPYTTYGGGARVELRWQRYRLYAEGTVAHTRLDDFLYLDRVTAFVGQVGVRVTP